MSEKRLCCVCGVLSWKGKHLRKVYLNKKYYCPNCCQQIKNPQKVVENPTIKRLIKEGIFSVE